MHARDAICSFIDGEHLRQASIFSRKMSPSFPEMKLHNGNQKVKKKKILKCLLGLVSLPFPPGEATGDFYSPTGASAAHG